MTLSGFPARGGRTTSSQYSKDGTLLQVVDAPGLPLQILGAEFRSPVLFADGFDGGNSDRWSITVP